MTREFVSWEQRGTIALITMDAPPVNAVSAALVSELREVLALACVDSHALVVTGGDKVFATGAAARCADVFADADVPVVAAISGYALDGGLALALGADWRITGDNAKFGMPAAADGAIPDAATCARLASAMGIDRAKALLFGGAMLGADDARSAGLVDQVTAPDDVLTAAVAWAGQYAEADPRVLRGLRAAVNAATASAWA